MGGGAGVEWKQSKVIKKFFSLFSFQEAFKAMPGIDPMTFGSKAYS